MASENSENKKDLKNYAEAITLFPLTKGDQDTIVKDIFIPYCPNGSCDKYFSLNPEKAKDFFSDTVEGLYYKNGVIHLDVNLKNMLKYDEGFKIPDCDSCYKAEQIKNLNEIGTTSLDNPPEYYNQPEDNGEKIDAPEKKCDKAKVRHIFTIGSSAAKIAANFIKKKRRGENIDVEQDFTKPAISTTVRCAQIGAETVVRKVIKSKDKLATSTTVQCAQIKVETEMRKVINSKAKKLGFKKKAGIAVAGAAIISTVNQFAFNNDKSRTSEEKLKEVAKDTVFSGAEYSLNYVANKGVNKVIEEVLKKAISESLKAVSRDVVGFFAGMVVDGARIAMSNEENKRDAFKQAAIVSGIAAGVQVGGSVIGSLICPGVGTMIGRISGGIIGSLLSVFF